MSNDAQIQKPLPLSSPPGSPLVVTDEQELARVARALMAAPQVAVDLESNGLFAYRAEACIVQLWARLPEASEPLVVVVDALATPLAPLGALLASSEVTKIVHDVAFDARILAEAGVTLANARDTSIAARMLGFQATGLQALLQSQLGVSIEKTMQHHDWGKRPLDPRAIGYLEGDVMHLEALADNLWLELETRGIAREVEEETKYRLEQAIASASAVDPRLPYMRLKGIDRAGPVELSILKRLADVREERARELDVPPYKVLGPDTLFAIAEKKPRTMAELERVRGATSGSRARALARSVLAAVAEGLAAGSVPAEERARIDKPRLPGSVVRARREREQRLSRWRKVEAKRRGVDEQVVLPGHCLQDLADIETPTPDSVRRIPGLGAFRIERDAGAWLAALEEDASP